VDEVYASEGVFCIASVDGEASEDGVVAEVFHTGHAETAGAIDSSHPGDTDSGANGEFRGSAINDFAHDLVAGNDAGGERRKVALNDVQVGAADSACEYAEENVIGEKGRRRDIKDLYEVAGSGAGRIEDGGLHSARLVADGTKIQFVDSGAANKNAS